MADLSCEIAGIKSPNPFWLASSPATLKADNVRRGFEAGWGGAVWKTISEVPVVNVNPRYGSLSFGGIKMVGFNNIELISDRLLEDNLREIKEIKNEWPDRALLVSIMAPYEENKWKNLIDKVEQTGADGIELNLSCPHGMSERGMGAAIGQVPEYVEKVTCWAKSYTKLPVLVKLTPNVSDIRVPAVAAKNGGADGVSLINTINSIAGVNLDLMAPQPTVGGKGTYGGYSGPAIKPIALNMVSSIAGDSQLKGFTISGIGGISTWHDAAEFMALGASGIQVCTAAMHFGFRIVENMVLGLNNWMDEKKYRTLNDFIGAATANVVSWENLDLNYQAVAQIDQEKCVNCGLCYVVCQDTSHQAVSQLKAGDFSTFEIKKEKCVGCSLCYHVCPVRDCVSMVEVDNKKSYLNWKKHPHNPECS